MYRSMPADLYQRMEHIRRAELERDATKWRLLSEGRQGRSWLSRSAGWLLCQLGHQLVTLGRALEHSAGYHSDMVRTYPWRTVGREGQTR